MVYFINILLCISGILLNVMECNYNSNISFINYLYTNSLNIINAFLISSAIIMISVNLNYIASISIGYTINGMINWLIKKI